MRYAALIALMAALPLPAAAATAIEAPAAPVVDSRPIPAQLTAEEKAAYRAIFAAIREGRFSDAASQLDRRPDGLLTPTARAELWLTAGSPQPSGEAIKTWLVNASAVPQATRVVTLARKAGLADLPLLPAMSLLRPLSFNASEKPRSAGNDAEATRFADQVKPLLAADKVVEAELLLQSSALSGDALTQWMQRIAWAYYLAGDDLRALALASKAAAGSGPWAGMGDWVAGLAAFRTKNCELAGAHFARVSTTAHSGDLAAAGYFWSARADMACGHPERVSARLRLASRYTDSFYGLLAARSLGIEVVRPKEKPDFILADWKHVENLIGARRAAALVEIGELGLADKELRYLAATGQPENHLALTHLAARLNLPATQYWLANNAPAGVTPPIAVRYPAPEWVPYRGWRVDKSLVFAHALQESRFVTDARSRAGARGVMQVMPGTARQIATGMAEPVDDARLTDPAFNIECGQTYLETLRDSEWTGGLLPKVIAAYNAGPGALKKWSGQLRYDGDPLLYIESIPYAETRHYVEIVLKNYWMYQIGDGKTPASLSAIAQGLWPRFPGMPGETAVRMDDMRLAANAN